MFHIFEFIRSLLGVKCQHIFQTLQNGAITGLQTGAREITNRGSLRVFKPGIKDCKSGQGFQIGAKRFQIGAKITNWGKRDYKQRQLKGFQIGDKRLQIGAGISNWGKEISNRSKDFKLGQERLLIGVEITNRGRDYKSVQNTQNVIAATPKCTHRGFSEPNKRVLRMLYGLFQRVKMSVIN